MKDIAQCLVMIVEDSKDDMDLAVELLSPICNVAAAMSGADALSVAELDTPDLFLVDVRMSSMSGFDLCRILKSSENLRHVPVIFLSDLPDPSSRRKGLSLGAVDYISKPFDPVELKMRIEAHLRLKVAREALERRNDLLEGEVLRRTEDLRYAMKRLEASETEFRSLAEGLPDMVFRVGSDGRFRYVSGAVRDIMGLEPGDVVGRTPEEAGLPSICPAIDRSVIEPVMTNGERLQTESPIRKGGDSRGIAEVRMVPEREGAGIVSVLGLVRDVSSQRIVEERYRRLFSLMKDGLVLIENPPGGQDSQGFRVLEANPSFSAMTGLREGEIIGRPIAELLPSLSRQWIPLLAEVLAHGEPRQMEGYSGEMARHIETVMYLADLGSCACMVRDVTEQREAQESLAAQGRFLGTLVENMPMGVFAKDLSVGGVYVVWNSRMSDIFGISGDDALYRTASEIFDQVMTERVLSEDEEVFRNKEPMMFEYERSFTEGTLIKGRHLRVVRVPLNDEDGNPSILLGIVEDITGLVVANERLEESLKDKDILIQEVHHRVKNNLQVMASLMSLQAARASDPHLVEVLQDSKSRIMAMACVHELLYRNADFSNLEVSRYMGELVGGLASTYGLGRDIGIHVDTDDTRLHVDKAVPCGLIVSELVTNALKHGFTGRTSGNIWVSVKTADSVVLEVADDGCGAVDSVSDGEGLGMTIVKGLVRQLGGEMEVSKAQGLLFRITFPSGEGR